MQIKVDDVVVLELTDIQKKVIMSDINEDEFVADMQRRAAWVIQHKYEQCFDRLKKGWTDKLAESNDSLPTNPDKLAEMIFAHPDYCDKKETVLADNAKKAEDRKGA